MSHPVHPGGGPGDFDRLALGYAQRRVVLVAALLGGLCITVAGATWALSSAALGEPPGNGLTMALVGLGATALGWLATAGLRFTGKEPKTVDGNARADRMSGNRVISGWIAFGLVFAACLAAFFLAPRGQEPDVVALLLMMASFPVVLLLGFYRIRWIMRSRSELYARWLAKHPG
ncbi:hypothetical protein JOF48_002322 [Arthrobacter stackebrandtii]|uniref:Transmembrane protein n=1 Tax=Arthrobacter stackebrandtii TaxID=272161 RepID=A0ABS4YXM2_9MICC|nr:hypothetical protein [Arthrobacter stackebrandtii]MBP2413523.1 hypothetical protein [Arthrobacter stackebrandtii]PYH00641.1 hypothetical protein CVV67_08950 [Arthrobacter stackebrandtii]